MGMTARTIDYAHQTLCMVIPGTQHVPFGNKKLVNLHQSSWLHQIDVTYNLGRLSLYASPPIAVISMTQYALHDDPFCS